MRSEPPPSRWASSSALSTTGSRPVPEGTELRPAPSGRIAEQGPGPRGGAYSITTRSKPTPATTARSQAVAGGQFGKQTGKPRSFTWRCRRTGAARGPRTKQPHTCLANAGRSGGVPVGGTPGAEPDAIQTRRVAHVRRAAIKKINVRNRTDIQAYLGDATAAGHCGDSLEPRKKKQ